jgi:hypothetical protein
MEAKCREEDENSSHFSPKLSLSHSFLRDNNAKVAQIQTWQYRQMPKRQMPPKELRFANVLAGALD